MKEGTIYKIVTNHNGFVYIGQTIQNLRRRWHKHLSDLKSKTHHNQLLQKVYDKYGEQDFVFEVIEKCNIAEIDERERYWINFYDSTNREKGYNFESGGNENKKLCAETIEKIRRERNIEYVGKSKAEGKTNPEIAKDLNLNRCTITVYWKEYKQKYADTVISQEIKKS